jgi:hypothetical protein
MKSNEVGTTLKHPETINGNVKNLSKSDLTLPLITRVGGIEGGNIFYSLLTFP